MTPLQLHSSYSPEIASFERRRKTLADGAQTTVYVAEYAKDRVKPKLVEFPEARKLKDWCDEKNVSHAIGGGFFSRKDRKVLGELVVGGQSKDHVPVAEPWRAWRAGLNIDKLGGLAIGPRYDFDQKPDNDFLTAGPMLVKNGSRAVYDKEDTEGFAAASYQFDSDITDGRYPRLAIALNETHIFTVACDGRADGEAGMTMTEFADEIQALGATEAINLDGGSSTTLIYDREMQNVSWGGKGYEGVRFEDGRPIHNAIYFEEV